MGVHGGMGHGSGVVHRSGDVLLDDGSNVLLDDRGDVLVGGGHRGGVLVVGGSSVLVVSLGRGVDLGDGRSGDDLLHGLVANGLTTDDGVESVVGISGVLDDTVVAIGIVKAVRAVDDISFAGLLLTLDVSGLLVMDLVREVVLGGRIGVLDVLGVVRRLDGLDDSGLGMSVDGLRVLVHGLGVSVSRLDMVIRRLDVGVSGLGMDAMVHFDGAGSGHAHEGCHELKGHRRVED